MKISEELEKRNLPEILKFDSGTPLRAKNDWNLRREQIEENLVNNLWGRKPDWQEEVSYTVLEESLIYDDKALKARIELEVDTESGAFAFPFDLYIPMREESVAAFIHIAFNREDGIEDDITEYLIKEGFAYATFYYRDIIDDLYHGKENGIGMLPQAFHEQSWGKVRMWAWGASRIMDYLETLVQIDSSRVAVVGHSRLGKAALCAGALDQRFSLTITNNSGGGGIALMRGKRGEKVKHLGKDGSKAWLCEHYNSYAGKEEELPFDHHFAGALVAPRNLYVASATEDKWADPLSEFLSAAAASDAYRILGLEGLKCPDEIEFEPMVLHGGKIGFHLRDGKHYMGRYDWEQFVSYRKKHRC